jgi:hypothetical protein
VPRALVSFALLVGVIVLALFALGRLGPSEPAHGSPISSASPTSRAVATATGPATVTLTFTADDLTAAARQYTPLTLSGVTVTDPVVTLAPGLLTLRATGRAFLLSGPVVIVASPLIVNGRPAAQIESATFAGFGLPDSTKQSIADTFAQTLAANIPAGVRVTSITVGAGTLVVQTVPA